MAQLALNRFQTETVSLTTSNQTIYTAPTGYTGIILYAHVTNVGVSDTTVTVSHSRGGTTTELIKQGTVPVNDAFIPLDGKLVLETGDSIVASAGANSTLKILLSILETANA
jgi:hypothetical protein